MPAPSKRSTFSPHPSMGLPPRWTVGDLPQAYSTPVLLINQFTGDASSAALNPLAVYDVSGTMTSPAFNPQANSVELFTTFSDASGRCDLVVTCDDGTGTFVTVATFLGVNLFKESNLFVGEFDQGITLQGRAIKVTVQNFSGTGTVTVKCSRLN